MTRAKKVEINQKTILNTVFQEVFNNETNVPPFHQILTVNIAADAFIPT